MPLPIPKPRHSLRRQFANAQYHRLRPQLLMNLGQGIGRIFRNKRNDFHCAPFARKNIERRTPNAEHRSSDPSAFGVRRSMFDVFLILTPSPVSPPRSAPARAPEFPNTKAPPNPKTCF